MNLPDQVVKTVYLHLNTNLSTSTGLAFTTFDTDMSSSYPEYVCLAAKEIVFTMPKGLNPTTLTIEAIKKEQQRVRAEAEVKANAMQERIDNLLALEGPTDE